jgi:hypothetical protein
MPVKMSSVEAPVFGSGGLGFLFGCVPFRGRSAASALGGSTHVKNRTEEFVKVVVSAERTRHAHVAADH